MKSNKNRVSMLLRGLIFSCVLFIIVTWNKFIQKEEGTMPFSLEFSKLEEIVTNNPGDMRKLTDNIENIELHSDLTYYKDSIYLAAGQKLEMEYPFLEEGKELVFVLIDCSSGEIIPQHYQGKKLSVIMEKDGFYLWKTYLLEDDTMVEVEVNPIIYYNK